MTRKRARPAAAPLTFTRFLAEVIRVQLTPGQRVLCLVAFDGLDPCDLTGADRELAREIFGEVETIPPEARHVIAAMCGARAGKSYVLCALRMLHLALTVPLTSLAPGEAAAAPIVAPDLRLARQTLRYVSGAAHAAPSIARLIAGETADSITLRRPDGAAVEVVCLPATRGGSALRGRTLVGAVLDEAAFFRDTDYQVNDEELFRAVAPRVLPGGQVVIASTPWAQSGLLWTLYDRNHGHPIDALAAHAPTLLLRSDAHTRSLVERERERDPDNAAREFDAIPMAAGAAEFFDLQALRAATDDDMPLVLEPAGGTLGLDTGFRKDPTAGVVVRCSAKVFEVAECIEIRPPAGGRLVPSAAIKQLLDRAQHHGCPAIAFDQHYAETVREHARARKLGLLDAPTGIAGKLEVFTAARAAIHEGKVRIPAKQVRLLAQLRQVVSKPTPGGQISITSPRRGGAHGDLASAFVLALWAEIRFARIRAAGPRDLTVYGASTGEGRGHMRAEAMREERYEREQRRMQRRLRGLTGAERLKRFMED